MISFGLVVASAGCVDRIDFPLGNTVTRFVIDGFITTGPPPYMIDISESIDITDPFNVHKPRTLKYLLLMDDIGNTDTLKEPIGTVGRFFSPDNGMRGTPGRAYKIRFGTLDGREYESIYDTMRFAAGGIDSVYREFGKKTDLDGKETYGFDIFFDTFDPDADNLHLWQINSTYQVETDPKHHRSPCTGIAPDCPERSAPCGCLAPLPCSGYDPGPSYGDLVYVKPCECCTCWVTITNNSPIVQDVKLTGRNAKVFADFLPLTAYTFMFKVHVQVDQYTVSSQPYRFYRAVLNQQTARNSLFQPVTGKLPGNIVQISGTSIPSEGIFFAASITSRSIFIHRREIPDQKLIPQIEPILFANKRILNSCLDFPVSTTQRPSFWGD